jgi:hypothetical protein
MLAALTASPAGATIYYVSPGGSDLNAGTSPSAPWGSVAKVDSTSFQPGDQILFQYGSTWNANLNATSSGTTTSPIVYGAYGNPSLGNPTFCGSDPISSSAFTQYSGNTYVTTLATPANWVYQNSSMLHEAADYNSQAGQSTSAASDLATVLSNPNQFYYNSGNGQLFVNIGSTPLASAKLAIGTRQYAINTSYENNLIFRDLNTSQTANDNFGYGVYVNVSSNVTISNSTVSSSAKHAVSVIDATGVTINNVVANGSAPDQGFGGASAFVSYSDATGGALSMNSTSVYTNDTYVNANGPYPAFISHGGTNGIASITLNNLNSVTGYGSGIVIYGTGSSEVVLVNGGRNDGGIEMDTNNWVINGVTLQGASARVQLGASYSVVQNSVINGVSAAGAGVITDNDYFNTDRFNVILPTSGAGIVAAGQGSNPAIYGNIITNTQNPAATIGVGDFDYGGLESNYNVFAPGTSFQLTAGSPLTALQWQGYNEDEESLFTGATFNNSAAGDFSLASGSYGFGLVPGPLAATSAVADALIGKANPNGTFNAGLNSYVPGNLNLVNATILINNAQTNIVTPAGGTMSIQTAGQIALSSSSTIDLVGNIQNAGSFLAYGTLIQTGNFNNSGSFYVSGPQTWSPFTVFTNTGGVAVFASDAGGPIAPAGYLTVNVSGGSVIFASAQHLAGINVLSGGTLQVASHTGTTPLVVTTPSLTVVGILDLTNNDLVVQSGNLAAVTALVKSGYNQGLWNGTGITSSTAAADTSHLTAIGVIQNSVNGQDALYGQGAVSAGPLGLFDAADPNNTDVLVKYTYYGDTNLDGKVDGSDYSRLDNGFSHHLTGWYNGDFNYDGIINGSDYTLIDNAFNEQGVSLTSSIGSPLATSTAQIADQSTSVPEPAAVGIAALFTLPLLRRRKPAANA